MVKILSNFFFFRMLAALNREGYKYFVQPCSFFIRCCFMNVLFTCDTYFIVWCCLVPFRHGERIAFSYLVSQKYTGENALVKVLRDSKVYEFNIKLATHKRLIPAHIKGKPPSYYIIAGFVFTAISVPYLRSEVWKLSSCLLLFLILFQFCFLQKVMSGHCWMLCLNSSIHKISYISHIYTPLSVSYFSHFLYLFNCWMLSGHCWILSRASSLIFGSTLVCL